MPLANAEGSARGLGARSTRASPRARGAPCFAASSPRQRKSCGGGPAGAEAGLAVDGVAVGDVEVFGAVCGACGAARDAGRGGVEGAGRVAGVEGLAGSGELSGCPDVAGSRDPPACGGGIASGEVAPRRVGSTGNKSTKNAVSCRGGKGIAGRSPASRHKHHASNACRPHTAPAAHQAILRTRGAGKTCEVSITSEDMTANPVGR